MRNRRLCLLWLLGFTDDQLHDGIVKAKGLHTQPFSP